MGLFIPSLPQISLLWTQCLLACCGRICGLQGRGCKNNIPQNFIKNRWTDEGKIVLTSDEKVSAWTNLFFGMQERAQEEIVVCVLAVDNVSPRILIAVDSKWFVWDRISWETTLR